MNRRDTMDVLIGVAVIAVMMLFFRHCRRTGRVVGRDLASSCESSPWCGLSRPNESFALLL
jgi:hypothetical protein